MDQLRSDKAIELRNRNCPYCGQYIDPTEGTRDHVVGRRFVPRGSLSNTWNVILKCCRSCNNYKSDLEDDISAITQLGSPLLNAEPERSEVVARKARGSISRRTGKFVADSQERQNIDLSLGPSFSMSVGFVGGPQIDENRAAELAQYHMRAFFFLITFDEEAKVGHFWPGVFWILKATHRKDWGNPLVGQFISLVADWEERFHGVTANEHFKCSMRRKPNHDVWSWALEWNNSFRQCGFFGDESQIEEIVRGLDFPKAVIELKNGPHEFRMYKETPLVNEDDGLFSYGE